MNIQGIGAVNYAQKNNYNKYQNQNKVAQTPAFGISFTEANSKLLQAFANISDLEKLLAKVPEIKKNADLIRRVSDVILQRIKAGKIKPLGCGEYMSHILENPNKSNRTFNFRDGKLMNFNTSKPTSDGLKELEQGFIFNPETKTLSTFLKCFKSKILSFFFNPNEELSFMTIFNIKSLKGTRIDVHNGEISDVRSYKGLFGYEK